MKTYTTVAKKQNGTVFQPFKSQPKPKNGMNWSAKLISANPKMPANRPMDPYPSRSAPAQRAEGQDKQPSHCARLLPLSHGSQTCAIVSKQSRVNDEAHSRRRGSVGAREMRTVPRRNCQLGAERRHFSICNRLLRVHGKLIRAGGVGRAKICCR